MGGHTLLYSSYVYTDVVQVRSSKTSAQVSYLAWAAVFTYKWPQDVHVKMF